VKKESLKLTGRVVSVNAADQSIVLESTEKSNRLRVYADDKAFKKLNNAFQSAWFNGAKGGKLSVIFQIQVRVLKSFIKEERKSLAERYPAFTALVNREVLSE
jgi:hypothetical protein